MHEERDRIEIAIVNEMLSKKTGHRDKLDSEHRQKALLDRYMKCSKMLLSFHEQQAKIPASQRVKDNRNSSKAFNEFYQSLQEIRNFYNTNSNEQVVTMASEFEEIEAARQIALGLKQKATEQDADQEDNLAGEEDAVESIVDQDGEMDRLTRGLPARDLVEVVEPPTAPIQAAAKSSERTIEFTDEEGYGRYLDLNKCHDAFLQVIKKEETKPNYLAFLNNFDRFENLDRELKLTSAYKIYLEEMLAYFRDYSKRAKPLFDYHEMESRTHEYFVDSWTKKSIAGWFQDSDREKVADSEMVDLDAYRSYEELMELGLDCLKSELQARGLKCGGTLEERAKRLWSVKGKQPHEIDDSLRAGPVMSKKGKKKSATEPFYIASLEAKIFMYAEYYADHRQATIENVQRKQARTVEERNESDEDISDIDDDDNDEGDVIYNPKNLPLGWDGKPIPYWLYKLHGLNLTFTCEICGNATYKGPKTFQRHFAEWRHAHGMRCLGIPNTAHFANITKIEDAINLWEKLKNERQKEKFQPLNEEEYEDSLGNVVNKKTYEDLKRQGLL